MQRDPYATANLLEAISKDIMYLVHHMSTTNPESTGSSRLMRISLLRFSLLRFFKTITKIWLMRFYGLFILLLRT